ncbi:MAG: hypothetical protein ABL914_11200 [Novosphingobium sp.]|uniref:hypothetical protein n=1 Tax=Novosphingobium sp. TaxID=1874826 RepID=UPI0032BE4CCF
MNCFALWPRAAAALTITLGLILLGAQPLLAQRAAELDRQAVAEYNSGLDARDAGQNRAACQHFQNAETLYHNSITALLEYPMRTDEQREEVKQMANRQQQSLDGAKAKVRQFCGPGQSGGSEADLDYAKQKLQLGLNQYSEAGKLLRAGDGTAACASARQSARNLADVVKAIEANPALANVMDAGKVRAFAQQVANQRDGTFCAG